MRKSVIMIAAMFIAVSASANSVAKKAKAPKAVTYTATETTFDVNGNVNISSVDAYNVAEINVPARVRFIEGNAYGINVIALNGENESSIHYKVKGGKLSVYSTSEFVDNNTFVINLVVPTLPEVKTRATLDMINVR